MDSATGPGSTAASGTAGSGSGATTTAGGSAAATGVGGISGTTSVISRAPPSVAGVVGESTAAPLSNSDSRLSTFSISSSRVLGDDIAASSRWIAVNAW